jgi:hypothetical protein
VSFRAEDKMAVGDSLDAMAYGDPSGGPMNIAPSFGGGGSSSGFNTADALGLGALGIGAGIMLGKGETPLPPEYAAMGAMVPGLQQNAATLFGQGQQLAGEGRSLIQKAGAGELTLPQQAELKQYSTGLQNMANQQFAAMGRNITSDTSGIGVQADIDAKINAMAQQEIRTTLTTGFQELQAGQNEFGQSLGYSEAAAKILQAEGEAQLKQDQAYSQSLTNMFGSIAKIAGAFLA